MRNTGLVVLLALAAAGAACAQGVVKNGGFAIDAKLDGWLAGQAAFAFADDDGFAAPGCVRVKGPTPARAEGPSQGVALRPNTDYVLSAALKSDGKLAPSVRLRTADGRDVVVAGPVRETRWTPVRIRFNSGANEKLTLVCIASEDAAPAEATAGFDDVAILLPSEVPAGAQVEGGLLPQAPGENVARGCPVTFTTRPNYGYSTDAGDDVQLTDGAYSAGYFWVQPSTVGWSNVSPVVFTLDLGKVQPICGLSFNTAAGCAGVAWPSAILVAASDDGKTWRYVGDLVALAAKHGVPASDRYSVYRYWTDELQARGRYVKVAVAGLGSFVFCDEVEVYRGPEALLAKEPAGEVVADLKDVAVRVATRSGILVRLTSDLADARAALQASSLGEARKAELGALLDAVAREIPGTPNPDADTFKTIFPLNDLHARIFSVRGAALAARGLPRLFAWKRNRYDYLAPGDAPEKAPDASVRLDVEMLGNEVRAEDFLVTNASEEPATLSLRVKGLPGGARPSWLRVSAVPWTDTSHRVPVAAALPDADYAEGAYAIPVPAGMTRRVWLTLTSADLKPGTHKGSLVLSGMGKPVVVRLRVRVSPVKMGRPRVSLGMWDYTNNGGCYGITAKNMGPAIALEQSHFVDTPWATGGVLPWPQGSDFDAEQRLKEPLKFERLDEWVKMWPNARQYFTFPSVGSSFADAEMGTPAFAARVGTWAKALAQHMRDLGLKPEQLGLLLVDEPHDDKADAIVAAWAHAINAAAPGLTLFQDPTWLRPDQAPIQDAISAVDVVCPNVQLFHQGGDPVAAYYQARRAAGQTLWFYQCSGPAKLFDPYRYHRLVFWHSFRHGAVGVGFWAFGDTGGAKSSWNEYASAGTPYTPAFLGIDDATDGIHWQAVREGVQDYETLAMLRDAAAVTKRAALRAEAEALLAEAPAAVLGEHDPAYDWKKPVDRTPADAYRIRAIRLLEKLR